MYGSGDLDDAADVTQHLVGHREVVVACVRACAEPGDALVDRRGRVRHRAQDGHAVGEVPLDLRGRDRGRDREHGLLRREQPADLAEQHVEVLRLDGDHDEGRVR